jgi:hypothetical protein
MLGGTIALSIVLIGWMRYDEIDARRADARRDRLLRSAGALEAQRG